MKSYQFSEYGQPVFPWIGCGDCPVCTSDNEHLCPVLVR